MSCLCGFRGSVQVLRSGAERGRIVERDYIEPDAGRSSWLLSTPTAQGYGRSNGSGSEAEHMLSSPGMLINTAQDHTPAAARLFQVRAHVVSQHDLSTKLCRQSCQHLAAAAHLCACCAAQHISGCSALTAAPAAVRDLLTWQPPASLPAAASPSPSPSPPRQQQVQVPRPLPRRPTGDALNPRLSPPAARSSPVAQLAMPRPPGAEPAVSPLAALANVASSGALMAVGDASQPAGATLSGQMHSPRRKRKAGSAAGAGGPPPASGARPRASAHLQPATPRQPASLQLLQPALSPRHAPAPAHPEAPAKEGGTMGGGCPESAAEEAEHEARIAQDAVDNRMPAPAQQRKGTYRWAGGWVT